MQVTSLKAATLRTGNLRRSGRVSGGHLWLSPRRQSLRTLLRALFAFSRRSPHRIATQSRSLAPVLVASALTVGPLSKDAATTEASPSPLSNGPLPSALVLSELLGSGTFGEVFRAFDSEAGREVAVKVVSKKRQGDDPASMKLVKQRIDHEVSMWCELQSFPGTVRLEKFYEDAEHVYFVQELCNGGSLEDLMKVRERLSEVEVAQIMKTVFALAAFCHDRNICYCDIKPANFILSSTLPGLSRDRASTQNVKVIDFGSCEHVPKNGLRGEKGTPLYMAPEVQNSRYNVESDNWSAGVLMYYLLSGEIPFIGNPSKGISPSALSFYLQFGELKFEAPVWQDVSQEAKSLLTGLLERNVKKRLKATEALEHPWMVQWGPSDGAISTAPSTFSAICPMDTPSVRMIDSTP